MIVNQLEDTMKCGPKPKDKQSSGDERRTTGRLKNASASRGTAIKSKIEMISVLFSETREVSGTGNTLFHVGAN